MVLVKDIFKTIEVDSVTLMNHGGMKLYLEYNNRISFSAVDLKKRALCLGTIGHFKSRLELILNIVNYLEYAYDTCLFEEMNREIDLSTIISPTKDFRKNARDLTKRIGTKITRGLCMIVCTGGVIGLTPINKRMVELLKDYPSMCGYVSQYHKTTTASIIENGALNYIMNRSYDMLAFNLNTIWEDLHKSVEEKRIEELVKLTAPLCFDIRKKLLGIWKRGGGEYWIAENTIKKFLKPVREALMLSDNLPNLPKASTRKKVTPDLCENNTACQDSQKKVLKLIKI